MNKALPRANVRQISRPVHRCPSLRLPYPPIAGVILNIMIIIAPGLNCFNIILVIIILCHCHHYNLSFSSLQFVIVIIVQRCLSLRHMYPIINLFTLPQGPRAFEYNFFLKLSIISLTIDLKKLQRSGSRSFSCPRTGVHLYVVRTIPPSPYNLHLCHHGFAKGWPETLIWISCNKLLTWNHCSRSAEEEEDQNVVQKKCCKGLFPCNWQAQETDHLQ